MTLKKSLLIPLAISLVFFVYFSSEILKSLSVVLRHINMTPGFVLAIVVAVLLQFIGHGIRAYKTKYILRPVKESSWKFQFRALSLGYLFNTVLPFRLGELVRSYVIATGDKISFGLSLIVIIFERSVDAMLLLILSLILLSMGVLQFGAVVTFIVLASLFAFIVFISITLLVSENSLLLKAIYISTGWLNERLKHSIRFKIWSVIYGLQRIMQTGAIGVYLMYTLISWVFYGASIAVVAHQVVGWERSDENSVLVTASPYYGVSLPGGPANLGTYSTSANSILGSTFNEKAARTTFVLLSWAVLVLPMSAAGLVLLFVKTNEPLKRKMSASPSSRAFINKLDRNEDISSEMAIFLDNYFAGNSLSRIVHRLERTDKFRLLRYFKGGSDAITVLAAEKSGRIVVKKIIAFEFADRLKAQFDWLRKHRTKGMVRALSELRGEDYYSIDLKFSEDDEMFFDYMHHHSLTDSQKIIDEVWDILDVSVYRSVDMVTDYTALDAYVDRHIFGCLEKAVAVSVDIRTAATIDKIIINGRQYDNINTIMKKIMRNKRIRKDLATYKRAAEVHGDVAVDNILVSKKTAHPLLIDPAPDGNTIVGPVFDFGKNMQSLYCGYEFLLRSGESVTLGEDGSINFQDRRSEQYVQLCNYVRNVVAPKRLSEGEQRAILFHAGALHIRRLKHQVYQDPSIALAIYATGVKTLNDFYAQYKKQ